MAKKSLDGRSAAPVTQSPLRIVKRIAEHISNENVMSLPPGLRGFYVLFREQKAKKKNRTKYDVKYIGLARKSLRGRLRSHLRSRRKQGKWTHFSVFEVWQNVRDDEIVELEGLLRFIFRKDSTASGLNIQRRFKKAEAIRVNDLKKWHLKEI